MNYTRTPPVALTIAGSDSGGGAGLQADLKTFFALRVHGASVVTAITAQNTVEVSDQLPVSRELVDAQIRAVTEDLMVRAAKTGMLATAEIVETVARWAGDGTLPRLIVDPVMVSATGSRLLEDDAIGFYRELLLPVAMLVTPNVYEAEILTGISISDEESMSRAAQALVRMGADAALVKGGHLAMQDSVDVFFDGQRLAQIKAKRISTTNTHGTGCTLSAAITALIARGLKLIDAIQVAKKFVTTAIAGAATWGIGAGNGPLDLFDAEESTRIP
jgi:hydroxymethylpyrimidine/phosphomethylpyrimidine kinase